MIICWFVNRSGLTNDGLTAEKASCRPFPAFSFAGFSPKIGAAFPISYRITNQWGNIYIFAQHINPIHDIRCQMLTLKYSKAQIK